jgi:hypothetical protein
VRIELGVVGVAINDVRPMLEAYGADPETIEEALRLAHIARARGPTSGKEVYSKQAKELFALEASAISIWAYEPTFVPGLFQTYEYASAILKALGESDDVIREKINVRLDRQALLEEDDRPELNILVGEAAVSRSVGGPDVMKEQIRVLQRYADLDRVSLYFLPFAAGPHPSMGKAFTILLFSDPNMSDLVYTETSEFEESIIRDDPKVIDRYRKLYAALQELAIGADGFAPALDYIVETRFMT